MSDMWSRLTTKIKLVLGVLSIFGMVGAWSWALFAVADDAKDAKASFEKLEPEIEMLKNKQNLLIMEERSADQDREFIKKEVSNTRRELSTFKKDITEKVSDIEKQVIEGNIRSARSDEEKQRKLNQIIDLVNSKERE